MFCSDDKHPDDLLRGHINQLIARALEKGYELFDLLHAATVLPVKHYKPPVGLLQPGDPADSIITRELRTMKIEETWIDGEKVFANGEVLFKRVTPGRINNFVSSSVSSEDFVLLSDSEEHT